MTAAYTTMTGDVVLEWTAILNCQYINTAQIQTQTRVLRFMAIIHDNLH